MSITYVGTGLYPIPEAARLLQMDSRKMRSWVREYDYTSRAQSYTHLSLVKRKFDDEDEQILSFIELMELHFIRLFRSEGVPMQTIRRAAEAAAERFGTDYPFAVQRFDTDGRSIFATLQAEESDAVLVEELRHGQLVFRSIVRPFFKKLDYDGQQEALRFWPMEKKGRVVLDPERQFGRPIDAQTGIPTETLFLAVRPEDGQDAKAVAKWFDVPIQAVNAAIRFERSLVP